MQYWYVICASVVRFDVARDFVSALSVVSSVLCRS